MARAGRLRAALLAGALACSLGAAPARASTGPGTGWKLGAALASLAYTPLKVAYAAAGAVFGGIAWGLSGGDRGVRDAVITPAVRGDYRVTPAHLRRERPLVFAGSAPVPVQPERAALERGDPETPWADPPYGSDYYDE